MIFYHSDVQAWVSEWVRDTNETMLLLLVDMNSDFEIFERYLVLNRLYLPRPWLPPVDRVGGKGWRSCRTEGGRWCPTCCILYFVFCILHLVFSCPAGVLHFYFVFFILHSVFWVLGLREGGGVLHFVFCILHFVFCIFLPSWCPAFCILYFAFCIFGTEEGRWCPAFCIYFLYLHFVFFF